MSQLKKYIWNPENPDKFKSRRSETAFRSFTNTFEIQKITNKWQSRRSETAFRSFKNKLVIQESRNKSGLDSVKLCEIQKNREKVRTRLRQTAFDGFENTSFSRYRKHMICWNAKIALALCLCSEIALQCQAQCKKANRCQAEMRIKPM